MDEAATVRVNGQPAQLLPGNQFEATVAAVVGTNAFSVVATDGSGNIKTHTYEIDVSAQSSSYTNDANGNLSTKRKAAPRGPTSGTQKINSPA